DEFAGDSRARAATCRMRRTRGLKSNGVRVGPPQHRNFLGEFLYAALYNCERTFRGVWMRIACKWFFGVLVLVSASPALGGPTLALSRTQAQTNAYAPSSQGPYFAEQVLENASPAHAQIFADWMGSNAGGATNTWHWVGTADATSQTDFDANSLTITGAQSFS